MDRRRNISTNKLFELPIRRRDEPMKKQNTKNEGNDSDIHRQETKEATGRVKVGE